MDVATTTTSNPHVAELIEGWRAFKYGSVRATTWRNYAPALRALAHYLGDGRAEWVTETHFVKYRQAREQSLDWVKRTRVAPLKAVTINQHLNRAHAIFEWTLSASPPLVSQNPVARLVKGGNKLKVERSEPVVVDGEAIEALIDPAGPEFKLEFMLMSIWRCGGASRWEWGWGTSRTARCWCARR